MTEESPYAPPRSDVGDPSKSERLPNGWLPCPSCSSSNVSMPGFTWWGGVLGQKLLTHIKCGECGTTYNGKSGKSNTPMIVVYQGVLLVIAVLVLIALNN